MLFIFSAPELIRYLWQVKTAVFMHGCLIRAVLVAYTKYYFDDCHGTVFSIAFDEVKELKISIFEKSFVECLYAECFYVDCYNECIIIFIFKIPYAECLFA
jgi:hypothetical protein